MQHFKPMEQMRSYGEKKSGKIPHDRPKVNGIEFDSQSEADRYMELLVLRDEGKIQNLEIQPRWELVPPQKVPGRTGFRKHVYTADFAYDRDGKHIVEDVKSVRTREERDYIINRKLMWFLLGIYVEEVIR